MKFLSRFFKSEPNLESNLEAKRAAQLHIAARIPGGEHGENPATKPLHSPARAAESPEVTAPFVARVEESSGEAVLVHGEPEPSVTPEHTVEAERNRALTDPLYLANEVLGFQLSPNMKCCWMLCLTRNPATCWLCGRAAVGKLPALLWQSW